MITIKSNTFTKNEKEALHEVLTETKVMFLTCYCPKFNGTCSHCKNCQLPIEYCENHNDFYCSSSPCETCDVKHLCYDILKICEHSEVLAHEKDTI